MSTPTFDPGGVERQRRYFILILIGVLLAMFVHMVTTILAGIIAGILLWLISRPLYDRILTRTRRRRGLAAGLSLIATVLVVIVPVTVILLMATADALRLAGSIQDWIPAMRDKLNDWMDVLTRGGFSLFGNQLTPDLISAKLSEFATMGGQFLLQLTQRTASSIANAVFMLFVALFTLYYFYEDGDRFLGWLKRTLPLEPGQSGRLLDSFFTVSLGTLKTIGIIGLIQGVAAGIAYVVIGVPAPFFLTVLTIFATVIPAVGGALVTVPVAIGLFLAGQLGWAITLLAWYIIVVANLDNFLRPHLMRREIGLHTFLIFIATLGGITRYGFFGVFVGPMIAALLNASLEIYRELYPPVRSPESSG